MSPRTPHILHKYSFLVFNQWTLLYCVFNINLHSKDSAFNSSNLEMLFSLGSQLAAARQNDTLGVTENRDTIVLSPSLETLLLFPPLRLSPLIQVSRGRPLKRPSIVLPPPSISSLCTTPVSPDRPAFEYWPQRESGFVTRDDWVVSPENGG